jgi:molecular chaperone DnaJ
LRLTGRGAGGLRGGPPGDLYVHLRVQPHPNITRQGFDLLAVLHIPVSQAALGSTVEFVTLDGTEELTIPPGSQTGREVRLRGRGVPHLQGRGRGDLIVTLVVDTPTDLTKEQVDLLRQFAESRGETVTPPEEGIMSRLKGAFK